MNERYINSKYGMFHFSYSGNYAGHPQLIDIYLDDIHIGYVDYVNLDEVSDLELLQLASQIE